MQFLARGDDGIVLQDKAGDPVTRTGGKPHGKDRFWEYVDDQLFDFRTDSDREGGRARVVKRVSVSCLK